MASAGQPTSAAAGGPSSSPGPSTAPVLLEAVAVADIASGAVAATWAGLNREAEQQSLNHVHISLVVRQGQSRSRSWSQCAQTAKSVSNAL